MIVLLVLLAVIASVFVFRLLGAWMFRINEVIKLIKEGIKVLKSIDEKLK